MAAKSYLRNNPVSLYQRCLVCYVSNLDYKVLSLDSVQKLRYLPQGVLVDIYSKMSATEHLKDMLLNQLSDLEVFERLLRFNPARQKLFECFTALMSSNKPLATELQENLIAEYRDICSSVFHMDISAGIVEMEDDLGIVDFGLRLGSFLSEAGRLSESIKVLTHVAGRLRYTAPNHASVLVRLDCLQRLLHSEAALCSFKSAERTFSEMKVILKTCPQKIPQCLLASIYTQFAAMFFARSEYDDSHKWSAEAMRHLTANTPEKIAIDVLRQAAKDCVIKRKFQCANMLICQAMERARTSPVFGPYHQKYADALQDYGFFLLNVDSIYQSVKVYQEALDVKQCIFGNQNFHVAIAHEDLSYACYVREYSTGDFTCAREHVEKAVNIMKDLVPSDHLMLASANRIKALLLEEIALDKITDGLNEDGLLQQSEDLHKFALHLSLEVFGEVNVQTAKHYGNLGRLYQTMNRYEEAERMHQKAIQIKTDLLGIYDYEVGLSIGHLASLYNYQMKKYREAEDLYLRSIEISLRLFGRSYTGLEYDYLGLCHVYEALREFEKYLKYASILESWQALRGDNNMNKPTYPEIFEERHLEDVKNQFFEMDTEYKTLVSQIEQIS